MSNKIKHQIRCDDHLWNSVLIFKLENKIKSNNEAVIELLERGLKN